jgi:carboxypeptidase C (cathepsin A)
MRVFRSFAIAPLLAVLSLTVAATPLDNAAIGGDWIQKDKRIIKRGGKKFAVFEHAATQSRLEYVSDSGICETTKGVKQHSGYLTVGEGMNMWFWFFEARKNPSTAPLTAWFNGGPGCSSMIGLFQEHGPCQFYNGANVPTNNKYSWNEFSNMIYIDQPVGVGFSYGNNNVSSSVTASPYVWKLIQNFYASFPEYKSREFGIFTESYGGHYGPEFARYIQAQNKAIAAGTVKGEKIKLTGLGINNGWINPADNYKALIDYQVNNKYKKNMITEATSQRLMNLYKTRCVPQLQQCWKSNTNADCQTAMVTCKSGIESPLTRGNFDVYDVRQPAKDPFPPQTYIKYLGQPEIVSAIGAKSKYQECPTGPLRKFSATGDGEWPYKLERDYELI